MQDCLKLHIYGGVAIFLATGSNNALLEERQGPAVASCALTKLLAQRHRQDGHVLGEEVVVTAKARCRWPQMSAKPREWGERARDAPTANEIHKFRRVPLTPPPKRPSGVASSLPHPGVRLTLTCQALWRCRRTGRRALDPCVPCALRPQQSRHSEGGELRTRHRRGPRPGWAHESMGGAAQSPPATHHRPPLLPVQTKCFALTRPAGQHPPRQK